MHSHETERPSVSNDAIPCMKLCIRGMAYDTIPCRTYGAAILPRARSTLIQGYCSEKPMTLPHAVCKGAKRIHTQMNDVIPCG